MKIAEIERAERAFRVTWADRSTAEFPFIWLRDNDRSELHPQTRERTFDLTGVELDIAPVTFGSAPSELLVRWPGKPEPSVYAADWLHAHRPGHRRHDPALIERELWDADTLGGVPRAAAARCRRSPAALMAALLTLKRTGLLVVDGLDDDPAAGEAFGDLIGFKRESNFGVTFEVISRPDPNNLAYTALALPLHTDLPNQQVVPSYQFLHSYRNDATGGESIFADGFRIAADFARDQPRGHELLTHARLPWRFHDEHCDIRRRRPLLCLDADGELECFVFNAHLADVPEMATDRLYDFYAAYRDLMTRVRDPKYAVHLRLARGEMVVFDNWRVLHARTAFAAESGDRHFRGYYIERNEIDSRIRVLAREDSQA